MACRGSAAGCNISMMHWQGQREFLPLSQDVSLTIHLEVEERRSDSQIVRRRHAFKISDLASDQLPLSTRVNWNSGLIPMSVIHSEDLPMIVPLLKIWNLKFRLSIMLSLMILRIY